jgi:hypothetical protein
MAITDRQLAPGTQLTAKYKGQTYTLDVVREDEQLRYRLADGRTFKSPSSAGSAVMGGKACNGWAFWRLATSDDASGTQPTTGTEITPTPSRAARQPVPKPQPKSKGRKATKRAKATASAEHRARAHRAQAHRAADGRAARRLASARLHHTSGSSHRPAAAFWRPHAPHGAMGARGGVPGPRGAVVHASRHQGTPGTVEWPTREGEMAVCGWLVTTKRERRAKVVKGGLCRLSGGLRETTSTRHWWTGSW